MSKHAYILAVDDEPINRYVLEDLLEQSFELQLLDSGQACLNSVEQRKPDLILLDISMPDMDGYEVCRRLQGDPNTADIPIIFLTARAQVSDEQQGLKLGAVDYITKPFSEALLLARMETQLSLSHSKRLLAEQYRELQQERAYIERIIINMREEVDFVDDAIRYLVTPIEKTNGDLLLSAECGQHRYFLIGDFTGHGLAAAMGGPLVSSLFYMLANEQQPLEVIIDVLNKELFKKFPRDLFMAGLFIDWDLQAQQVRLWNLGISDVFHYRQNRLLSTVQSTNLALGIMESYSPLEPSAVIEVEPSDRLYGYSDGLIEAKSESGEMFGKTRLKQLLEQIQQQQLELTELNRHLNEFAAENGISDDITLLEIAF